MKSGRPKIEKPKAEIIKARINREELKKIEEYCQRKGISKTELIRRAIEKIMGEEE